MSSVEVEVPQAVWEATLGIFEGFARREVEGGCLWYAERAPGRTRVALIGVPRQLNRRQNFEIPPDALAQLNQAVPDGFEVVGQVHAHPGDDVRQSCWDDDLVVSRRIASIVLPNWGAAPIVIDEVGIHAFQDGTWERLDRDRAARVITFDPSPADGPPTVLDLR